MNFTNEDEDGLRVVSTQQPGGSQEDDFRLSVPDVMLQPQPEVTFFYVLSENSFHLNFDVLDYISKKSFNF